jgi:hypothetical protein
MRDKRGRELVSRTDVGEQTGGEPEACILIYRFPPEPDLELVVTARHNGDAAIMVSPDEARRIGRALLDATAHR